MLQISDQAAAALKNTLDDADQEEHVFRLALNGEDFSMGIGTPEEGDEVYEHDGEPILAVSSDLAQRIDATLDVEQTNEGARLVLN